MDMYNSNYRSTEDVALHKFFLISFYWQEPRCFIPKIEHDKIGANNGQAMLVFMSCLCVG